MSVNFNPDEKKRLASQESSSSIQVNQADDLDESCFSVDAQNFEEMDNTQNIDLVDFEVSDELNEVEAQKNSKVLFFGNEGYTFKTNSGVEITVENPDDLGDIQVFENKETGEVFIVNANGAKITSSNENTSISIYNSKIQSINTKKGNDTINVYGSTIDNLNTGSGSDFVNIDDSSADKVKTSKDFLWGLFGSSSNSVNIKNSNIEKLETGYGNDTVVLSDSEVESLETKGGVDSISSNNTEITKDDLAKKDLKVEDGNYLDDFDVSKMPQVESDEVITLESGETVNVSDYIPLITQQEVGFETQEEYQQYAIQAISDNLESMKEIFQAQNDSDGVVANGFDTLKELSNIGISSEDVNEVIAEQEEIINNLTQAMNGESEMSFEEAYEKYTGSEFSTEKIDKYIELSNIASAVNSGCYYDKDYADKLEEATGKSVDEINQEFALCQNEVLGKSQALQNLVEDYSASQEGFADKLSSIISTSGMVCIAVGAVVSFIPGGAAIGVPLMAVGKNVALGGMLVDNAIDLVDYSTDKDGLTGDEVKNLALETGVELVSYGTGRAIGYGTNALNSLVSSKAAEAGIGQAGSYILGQSAETLADTALSLTADYTIAQGQSLITTGELMDGDDYWSVDRFLGEGQNQLMGILTGLSSAKINAYSKDIAQKNTDLKNQTDDVLKTGTNSNNGKPLQMDLQKFAQKPLQERMNEAITIDKIATLTEEQKVDMLSDVGLATKGAYEQALKDNESFQRVIYLSKIADPNGEPLSGRNITSLLALSNEDFQRIEDLIVVENRSKQFTGRNLVRFAELSDEELSIVKELLYLPERGEQQFNGDDIISLSKLSAEDFAKAKTYFNIENGNGQKFSGNEIITLSKLNEEEFSKAQHLFNIPERGDEQLSLNEILKTTKELNDEQFANAENLLRIKNIDKQYSLSDIIEMSQKYSAEQLARIEKVSNIEGREEQFSSWDINKLIELDEEQFARAEQLLYVEGREKQLDIFDIESLSTKLNDEQFARAQKLLYIENRDTQLNRFDILQIIKELNDEQFTLAQKLLYIEGRDKQLSGFDIKELAKEYDEQGLENISHLLNVPQRGENQFSAGEIKSLSKLSPEEYKKAESLFNIPERGEQQFDGYSIAYLSKLSPEEYKKAESLFNVPERGEHQFSGGDIEKLITLDDQGMEKAKTLFNVTSRGEDQLSGSDIAELAELTDEQFARVQKLVGIDGREEQFSTYDIKKLAEELDDEQFARAEQLIYIKGREEQLSRYQIDDLLELDDEQFAQAKKLLYMEGSDKQYDPYKVVDIVKEYDAEKLSRLERIYNIGGQVSKISDWSIKGLINSLSSEEFDRAEILLQKAKDNEIISTPDIAKIAKTYTGEQFERVVALFEIPRKRYNEFDSRSIKELVESDVQFERAMSILNTEGRNDISTYALTKFVKLDDARYNLLEQLLYIDGRSKQLDINEISSFVDNAYSTDGENIAKNIVQILQIKGTDKFDIIEITSMAQMLNSEQVTRIDKFLNVPERGENQFDAYDIAKLAQLTDEQLIKAQKLYNVPEKGDKQYKGCEIAVLASIDNPEEAISRLEAQKQRIYNNPDKYINGEYESAEAMKKEIDSYFYIAGADFLQLASVYDKEALDNLFRMRFDDVGDYVATMREFSFEDFEILNQLSNSTNIDGKPFLPTQKIQFIDLIDGYKKSGLDFSKMEAMLAEGKVDTAQLNIDLFNQIMKISGMTDDEIASIPKEKLTSWDTKYAHLLAKEINNSEDIAFSDLLRAANLENFENYIHDKSNVYGQANTNTKVQYGEMGLDYDKWLRPSKENEVQFVSKDKNAQQLTQIASQIQEDMNTLMQTPAKGFIRKQFSKFVKGDEFIIPNEYLTSKTKLTELVKILSDTSEQGQMAQLWKRAQGNLTNKDPNRVNNAKNTLTILDHLNQRLDDISKVQETKATKTLDLTIKMWDRNPQKDIFQGNYSTCCIGMGGGNGSAMPHFVMDTAYNMIELVNNISGKTIGNALCYFAKNSNGEPIFIVDNIEISNSVKPSEEVGIKLRDSITQYASNVAKEVTGQDDIPIYMSKQYNDVPFEDLPANQETISFMGDIDCEQIYMDLYGGWIEKENLTHECNLLKLKYQ